ncbi:MAG: hypothetical protein HY782_24235 [Chloroflexi bacterium]|nr:hypothetical protein [Chloroflexota bacterium]
MQPHRFLLISQHPALAELVGDALGQELRITFANSSAEAVNLLRKQDCEAVLLDARSFHDCSEIRTEWDGPIVLLVPRGAKHTVLSGYDGGADAHVPIPCDARELLARVKSVMRRTGSD